VAKAQAGADGIYSDAPLGSLTRRDFHQRDYGRFGRGICTLPGVATLTNARSKEHQSPTAR
jgi:hypothetical protein